MDAVEYLRAYHRMCTSNVCSECEAYDFCEKDKYEELIAVVEKWDKEHPRKTRQSEFLKQWPNARLDTDGCLVFTPCSLGEERTGVSCYTGDCNRCRREFWMEEVE